MKLLVKIYNPAEGFIMWNSTLFPMFKEHRKYYFVHRIAEFKRKMRKIAWKCEYTAKIKFPLFFNFTLKILNDLLQCKIK